MPLVRLLQACGLKYRFVNFHSISIGHMALEPDCFVKEGLLGLRPQVKEIWLAPENLVANKHLLRYWEQHLRIWKSPMARLLLPVAKSEELGKSYAVPLGKAALYPKIQSAWGDRAPLLKLTQKDYEQGWAALREMGLPPGAWFVCIHNRESGFYNDPVQRFRNGDIRSYLPAIEMIVEQGGWCVRMGDSTMTPLPAMPRVIDYTRHGVKSDRMDVFLCAACRCFLGCNSGLVFVTNVFGGTAAMVNMIPLPAGLPYGTRDVGIPKLIWSSRENRCLTFKEIFNSPVGDFRSTRLYEDAGLRIVDNTPDEIREVTMELLEISAGTIRYSAEDEELQRRFKALMRLHHYSYGAQSRVGRHFLRKHANLLADA